MRLRKRRGRSNGFIYLLIFLAFIGWLFGDNSNDRADKIETVPVELVQSSRKLSEEAGSISEQKHQAKQQESEVPAGAESVWVYVTGSNVNVRDQPGLSGQRIGSYSQPTRLAYLAKEGDWLRVRHPTEQVIGWMHSDYLGLSAPKAQIPANPFPHQERIVRKASVVHKAAPSDAQIRQSIVRESIRRYAGSCPCPFNTDRAGRRCGKRSAYSRPGGASPVCYVNDVTQEMINRFR